MRARRRSSSFSATPACCGVRWGVCGEGVSWEEGAARGVGERGEKGREGLARQKQGVEERFVGRGRLLVVLGQRSIEPAARAGRGGPLFGALLDSSYN